jgi:hypothetical protein
VDERVSGAEKERIRSFFIAVQQARLVKFRNNKWIGLNREGKPFTVHVKHGSTRKYPPPLVETVARDLKVSIHEFREWYKNI